MAFLDDDPRFDQLVWTSDSKKVINYADFSFCIISARCIDRWKSVPNAWTICWHKYSFIMSIISFSGNLTDWHEFQTSMNLPVNLFVGRSSHCLSWLKIPIFQNILFHVLWNSNNVHKKQHLMLRLPHSDDLIYECK